MNREEIREKQNNNKLLDIFFTPTITEVIEGRIKRKSSGRLLTIRFLRDEINFYKTYLKHFLFHLSFAYKSMSHMGISFDFLKNDLYSSRLLTPFCKETTTKEELRKFSNIH